MNETDITCRYCHKKAGTTEKGARRHEGRCSANPENADPQTSLEERLRATALERLGELELLITAGPTPTNAGGTILAADYDVYKAQMLGKLAEYRTLEGLLNG